MKRTAFLLAGIAALLVGCQSSETSAEPSTSTTPTGSTAVGFASVQPILAKCLQCHSGPAAKEQLDMSTYASVMKGSEHGPVVVPGNPSESMIVHALKGERGKKRMPPMGPLSAEEIAKIESWIQAGAKE